MLELNLDKTVKEAFFNSKGELVVYRKFGKQETIDIFEQRSRTWTKNPPTISYVKNKKNKEKRKQRKEELERVRSEV